MTVAQALEIMKTHVVTVHRDSNLADAVDRMDLYQVDELPVVDGDGRLCGMIRESDIALAIACQAFSPDEVSVAYVESTADLSAVLVKDKMSCEVLKVSDTDEITATLIRTMLESARRVPVVDSNDMIVGTLNRVDIIQALFECTITLS